MKWLVTPARPRAAALRRGVLRLAVLLLVLLGVALPEPLRTLCASSLNNVLPQ